MHVLIGDIHGCHHELMTLLDRIGPGADDLIVSVGDLVDRGPEPAEVVRFFRDTPNARAILGNHEDKHLRGARGELSVSLSQRICAEQAGAAYGELLEWFGTLPLYLELPGAIVVHAALDPDLPLHEQPRNVLLRGRWAGQDLDGDGGAWVHRYTGERLVVYGHHVVEASARVGQTWAIDTGACHGRMLTALILPEGRIVQVPAREDHWGRATREWIPRLRKKLRWKELDEGRDTAALALLDRAVDQLEAWRAELPAEPRERNAAARAHPFGEVLSRCCFSADLHAFVRKAFPTPELLTEALTRWGAQGQTAS